MAAPSESFIASAERRSEPSGHDVRFYEGERFPADVAAEFLLGALGRDGCALVFANGEHTRAIERALDAFGVDVATMAARGRLIAVDASPIVAEIAAGAEPGDILERTLAKTIRQLAAKGPLRAVGEAVDLLARTGHLDGAIRLEAAWSALRAHAHFDLLCIYSFSSFERAPGAASLAEVCAAHASVQLEDAPGPRAPSTQSRAERLLARAAEELSASLDVGKTIERVAQLAVPTLADWCLVDLVTEDRAHYDRVAVGWHLPGGEEQRDALKRRYPLATDVPFGVPAAIARREVQIGVDANRDDSLIRAVARDELHYTTLRDMRFRSFVVAPLVARGQAIGALTFLARDRNFEAHDTRLVEQLAAGAASAIDAARLFEAEQKARMRIGKMQEVTAALSRARTAQEVAEVACRIGSAAMDAHSGALWVARDDGVLRLAGSWGTPGPFIEQFREIPANAEGLPATAVMRSGEPVWVESEEDYESLAPAIFERVKDAGRVASYGAVPLQLDGRTVGVITFAHPAPHRYDADERAFYAALAQHCSQALDRARLLDAERRSNERLRLLASAGETLARSLELDETLRAIARLTVPDFADWCFVDLVEGTDVRRVISVNADADRVRDVERVAALHPVRLGDGSRLARAIASGEAALAQEVPEEQLRRAARSPEELAFMLQARIGSAIMVPLVTAQGERVGAISFMMGDSRRRYDGGDLDFARELGRRVALAIVNARLYAAAQDARRAAEDANRVKDEFLATVSHELRTPLNAIGGWASLLAADPSDSAMLEKGLEVIRRNVQSQAKIVEDILDASRIVSGKLRIDPRPVNLAIVVRDAVEVVRPSALARRIDLGLEQSGATALVMGDAQRLQQVVWNLVSNAVKFTPEGGHVRVRVEPRDASWTLAVEDDGPGIDPEFLPFVFDRFRQADSSPSRRFGGLGLGLAIVRHIVELHGGRVEATSDGLGHGACFRVALPRVLTAAGEAHAAAAESGPTITAMRILVVDDDPDARMLMEAALEAEGAIVKGAASTREAWDALASFVPDVIVSDTAMPGDDGCALIRKVRADRGRLGTIPAIALTAYGRSDDRMRALTAGFNAHVLKPLDAHELVAMIANLRLVGKA